LLEVVDWRLACWLALCDCMLWAEDWRLACWLALCDCMLWAEDWRLEAPDWKLPLLAAPL
jgi:hypothetical protein